jgi:hypothetical protein
MLAGTTTVSPGLAAMIAARSEPEPGVAESVVVVIAGGAAAAIPVKDGKPTRQALHARRIAAGRPSQRIRTRSRLKEVVTRGRA